MHYVTHDQEEAMSLSSRVAVMNHGVIEQVGPPDEIYERPATRFVQGFVGRTIRLRGMIEGDAARPRVRVGSGTIAVAIEGQLDPGMAVEVAMRPEDVRLQSISEAKDNCLAGQIVEVIYYGDRLEYAIRIDGQEKQVVTVDASKRQRASRGDRVQLGIDGARVKLWPL
jgi:ABC-type Fe3+/spermidine/putrescine transport system ATPase subunit